MAPLKAVAVIAGDSNVRGSLQFSQNPNGATNVQGRITGLSPGLHGFHIHALGDTTNGCNSTGPHFNPLKKNHGAPTDKERHAGDLGNIIAGPDGVAEVSIKDLQIPLSGSHSILGRAVVVHADPDDLGRVCLPYQLSTIKTLNGANYEDWKESLEMYLIINEKDLAMREPKPQDLTYQSTTSERVYHKQWYDSNRICLNVIKYTIEKSIRQSTPVIDIAVEYLAAVSEKLKKFEKSQIGYYFSLLDYTRYDGVSGVGEHLLKLVNYYNKLRSLGVSLDERYLIWKSLESLPSQFDMMKTSYNSQESIWTVDEMISIVTQVEESMKKKDMLVPKANAMIQPSGSKSDVHDRKGKRPMVAPKFHKSSVIWDKKKIENRLHLGSRTKPSFKRECFYCKNSGHKISDCMKLKKKQAKEGTQRQEDAK